MSEYIYNPPWAKKCEKCDGDGGIFVDAFGNHSNDGFLIECPTCQGEGIIHLYYTPFQWIEWYRQHGQPDYEIPDDLPVWVFYSDGNIEFEFYGDMSPACRHSYIIATDAGRPPEGWRLE